MAESFEDVAEELRQLRLIREIEQFLYAEVELLDQRRFDDWLDLFADDARYWMPMRRNVKFEGPAHGRRVVGGHPPGRMTPKCTVSDVRQHFAGWEFPKDHEIRDRTYKRAHQAVSANMFVDLRGG